MGADLPCALPLLAAPVATVEQPRVDITVTLPDSSTRPGTSFETTPFDIAASISKGLSEKVIIAKVDGKLWDLNRPLEGDCSLEVMDFDHPSGEAKAVFWHSSAHVLGEACEGHLEGCCLGHGPPIEDGFFYDMKLDGDRGVAPQDWPNIESLVKGAVKEKQKFERVEMPKEALLDMFKVSPEIPSFLRHSLSATDPTLSSVACSHAVQQVQVSLYPGAGPRGNLLDRLPMWSVWATTAAPLFERPADLDPL